LAEQKYGGLLRRALPTGKRASGFSKHIDEDFSRCGGVEDEMHVVFLCPFAKAAWFCQPWSIKSELMAADAHPSIPDMIHVLLSSGHPKINPTILYAFLWCLWKARNETLFSREINYPS
jgi:hypothetical protein